MSSSDKSLEIRVLMRGPVVASGLIHLDALLAAACTQEGMGDAYFEDRSHMCGDKLRGNKTSLRIPLARKEAGGVMIFRASAAHFVGPDNLEVTRWYKRWDEELDDLVDFQGRKVQVQHKYGKYRGYAMSIFYHTSLEMVFWACGRPRRIEELLWALGYIGKKTSQGFGEIRDVQVTRLLRSQDRSMFAEASGIPTRAIPVCMGHRVRPGTICGLHGYRTPYWEATNQVECWLPPMVFEGGDC